MNYIKHLSGFFNKVSADDRLNPTHVSLYVSLFQFWNACRFHNPISISRNEVMKVSKICSKATYHKCIRELNDFGYLSYQPSYNPFKGSLVYLFDFQMSNDNNSKSNKNVAHSKTQIENNHTSFQTSSKPVKNKSHIKNETSSEQAVVSYTNNSNNTKQQTIVNDHTKNNSNETIKSSEANSEHTGSKKEKSSAKKEKDSGAGQTRPLFEEVQNYFIEKKYPALEAEKFYYHYESNGWLVGKTPMSNWKASVENWMLNTEKFSWNAKSPAPGNLHTSNDKNYAEPL